MPKLTQVGRVLALVAADLWGGDGTVPLGVFLRDKNTNQLMVAQPNQP